MADISTLTQRTSIAYFTMEIALSPDIHTYAGGLGVLAGDSARSCADLGLPVVFVTLMSRCGYVRQTIDASGAQIDSDDPWEPSADVKPLDLQVCVEIAGRRVWVKPWLFVIEAGEFGIPVILLDTNNPGNQRQDVGITDHLYGGEERDRLEQEIILGIGGERVLRALGFSIQRYHLNEGHAALLPLALLQQEMKVGKGDLQDHLSEIREKCIFTTHTPIEAGQDRFSYELVDQLLPGLAAPDLLRRLAGDQSLNMTRLALSLSKYVNGVAERHAETAARMFPEYKIHAITNGVHLPSWACSSFSKLFDECAAGWRLDPKRLAHIDQCSDDAIWSAHQLAKNALAEFASSKAGTSFDVDVPIIGFARRMTPYKRPDLIFTDLDRLRQIASDRPFQLVFAGKAHPRDAGGKNLIRSIEKHVSDLRGQIKMAFLENYEISMARVLIAGADIWLNTPQPPLEASGTSGMKAALNGALNLSVLDGWWLEGWIEGVTGWSIGIDGGARLSETNSTEHALDLYRKLSTIVLPLYYDNRSRWIWMMKQSISKIAPRFNTHSMMRRYAAEAYFR